MAKYYNLSLDLVWKLAISTAVFFCVLFKKITSVSQVAYMKQFNIDNRISLIIGTELFNTFRAQIYWVQSQFLEQIFFQFAC